MVQDTGIGFKGIKIEMNKPYHFHDKGKKIKKVQDLVYMWFQKY